MNLAKKYKQLFEGKVRSNDSKLLKEVMSQKVQDVYDAVAEKGEEALETLNQYIEESGLEKEYDKFLNKETLSSTEEKALVATMQDALAEWLAHHRRI